MKAAASGFAYLYLRRRCRCHCRCRCCCAASSDTYCYRRAIVVVVVVVTHCDTNAKGGTSTVHSLDICTYIYLHYICANIIYNCAGIIRSQQSTKTATVRAIFQPSIHYTYTVWCSWEVHLANPSSISRSDASQSSALIALSIIALRSLSVYFIRSKTVAVSCVEAGVNRF